MHKPAASIDHISTALVEAFAFLARHPKDWLPADRLAEAAGAASSTIYRRFDNLVQARVVQAKRIGDFRHFKLHPDWQASQLGLELNRRSLESGSLGAGAPPT